MTFITIRSTALVQANVTSKLLFEYNQPVQLLNQYSFAIISALLLVTSAFLILRRGFSVQKILLVGLLAIVLLAGWSFLRPHPGTDASREQILSQVGRGTPVLIEMQSPY
jgi:hypothetical protein